MQISIQGDKFLFDGQLTYSDFPEAREEALGRLMNTRMVQAAFEDENPETVDFFNYPDGSPFDPNRQTSEFIAALPEYRWHGVIATTVNFQGGYPRYHVKLSKDDYLQNWDNNAFTPTGRLKWAYAERMRRVVEAHDDLNMAVMVGYFYFGQNHKLEDEAAVKKAVTESTEFLAGLNRGNVLIEINNECNIGYVHEILQPHRVHELIQLAQDVCNRQILVSTSYGGGRVPDENVVNTADFILIHGNGQDPDGIKRMVEQTRAKTHKPIVFNEDSVRIENLRAAWEAGSSWGYYDQGRNNYVDGFQSPPTNWSINTPEKKAFFTTVAELVGIRLD